MWKSIYKYTWNLINNFIEMCTLPPPPPPPPPKKKKILEGLQDLSKYHVQPKLLPPGTTKLQQ